MVIRENIDKIQIQINPAVSDVEQICDLLEKAGMRKRNPVLVRKSLDRSDSVVVAVHNDTVVGMGRLVGDGAYYATIWDVAVLPEYRRRGIGSDIVRALLTEAHMQGLYMVCLVVSFEKSQFYETLGFESFDGTHVLKQILAK